MSSPPTEVRPPIPEGTYDIAVVGGGINGAAIARDAVLRGKSVALFEKDDFASGTSSSSSKMIHGGIRYLEQLRFGLVYEALRERQRLLRLAPHLVRTRSFLLPVYEGARRGPLLIRLGLRIYDWLTWGRRLGKTRFLGPDELTDAVPGIRTDGLLGGGLYFDAVMDDARLCLANVVGAREEAEAAGISFVARNYSSVVSQTGTDPIQLEIEDSTCGRRQTVRAHRVVRAQGPWSDEELLVRSKGVHLVVPRLPGDHGLLLEHSQDGRVFFVIPWKGLTVIGTTETPHSGSMDRIQVEEDDVAYLLSEVRRALPGRALDRRDILGAFAGVRPLARDTSLLSRWRGGGAGAASRKHRVVDDGAGTLTVVGGKFTTYRAVAEDVVDRLFPRTRCKTRERPLPGGEGGSWESCRDSLDPATLELHGDGLLRALWDRHGSRLDRVLRLIDEDPALAEPLPDAGDVLRAEVALAARDEFVIHAEDFLDRRTSLRYSTGDPRELHDTVARVLEAHRPFRVDDDRRERWLAAREREEQLRQATSSPASPPV
jgi:glycerol-3-phosphate dehydrogenase